jgi:hypothetical protein
MCAKHMQHLDKHLQHVQHPNKTLQPESAPHRTQPHGARLGLRGCQCLSWRGSISRRVHEARERQHPSSKLKSTVETCSNRPRVGALRDEIPKKVRREPGNTGTDGPSRRRGATTLHRGGPEGRRRKADIAFRRSVVEPHLGLCQVALLLHHLRLVRYWW